MVIGANNRGPRTDPCGTPVSNEIVDDEILPILTKLVLAVKYNLIQFNAEADADADVDVDVDADVDVDVDYILYIYIYIYIYRAR